MAELILTDEEKASASYLDWDDASIGRGVKKIALEIEDVKGEDAISWCAGVLMLLARAIDADSEKSVMKVDGFTQAGKPLGDWEVTVRRLPPPTDLPINWTGCKRCNGSI